MALSEHEKQIVINMLEQVDEAVKKIILSTLEAFVRWLTEVAYSIYLKIKEGIRNLWEWLCELF
jgi:hypothetical protein